ncbi:uncharacterized protein LOC132165217 [Corylus avellana]|uniref:uncharacterized protein LOC132165217 n=1 Tax=Corylus avellana TaxID=13451 RepID=UPI001E1EE8CD|nr:uncharacterized protein LOC132165217 [Corylus avellana]
MEDARKRDGSATDDLSGEDILAWLSTEEDTVSQLMELLDGEDDEDAAEKSSVRFVEDPYSSPLVFQSSYVTINGNEESCGSSFSDSDSSVMVGIGRLVGRGVAWGSSEGAAGGWVEAAEIKDSVDGCDVFDWHESDGEVLATFLGEDFEQ